MHLLLQISPKESLSSVVQRMKGGTSHVLRFLRSEFPDLEEFLWGDHFWASGFFAETVGQREETVGQREETVGQREETVGQREETVVRRYIREQRKGHHAAPDFPGDPGSGDLFEE